MTDLEDPESIGPPPFVTGIMDSVGAGGISGWAVDLRDPRLHIRVDLILDGKYLGTVTANRYRNDLEGAGFGDAFHGFHFPMHPDALDGLSHTLEAVVSGTRQQLRKSPLDGRKRSILSRFEVPKMDLRFGPNPVRPHARSVPRLARKKKLSDFHPSGRSLPAEKLTGVSVIIPTFNRGAQLELTLLRSFECTECCDVEFIVVDDGSSDDTPQRLTRLAAAHPSLRFLSVANGGQGRARNLGVALARYEIVLFQGDDIRPAHSGFYRLHLEAHRRLPFVSVAVLGKVTWPDTPDFEVTFPMRHIQGAGQQQFGYYALVPYTFLDFRFFYTSNVSLKKQVIEDWETGGFNPLFREYGWEDAELAYRLSETHPGGFGTLYIPAPVATHHHHYNTRRFIDRQISTGRAAQVFCRMHPNLRRRIGLESIERVLTSPVTPADGQTPRADILSMVEGLQAWPCVLEQEGSLGQEPWHDDLLRGVFTMSYLQGYIQANEYPWANYDAAYRFILQGFQSDVHTAFQFDVFGRVPPFAAIAPAL